MAQTDVLQVDVEKILAAKNPTLARRLPQFLKNYLRRIVHQDELNDYLRRSAGITGLDFVDSSVEYMQLQSDVHNFDNVPSSGRFIFAANHPLGGLESLVFMQAVAQKFPNIAFMVNDILMVLKPLHDIFVPINKHGGQSSEMVRQLNDTYRSNKQVLYFPAGLCSRKIKGKIQDLKWNKSFIAKAIEYQRDIIPVFIDGRNSNFFYNLSNLRKKLSIKANIEMLYLVDEMYKQRGKTISLYFGKPIPYTSFDKSKSFLQWAADVRNIVYSLHVTTS